MHYVLTIGHGIKTLRRPSKLVDLKCFTCKCIWKAYPKSLLEAGICLMGSMFPTLMFSPGSYPVFEILILDVLVTWIRSFSLHFYLSYKSIGSCKVEFILLSPSTRCTLHLTSDIWPSTNLNNHCIVRKLLLIFWNWWWFLLLISGIITKLVVLFTIMSYYELIFHLRWIPRIF